jgi:hypothetical protein
MTTIRLPALLAAGLWLGVLCTGCALPRENTAEAREEKVYRTGSNIPVKDGQPTDVRIIDSKSMENSRPNQSVGSPIQKGG